MIEVTKTIVFDAAHRLPGTPEGHKCAGLHGHTWRVKLWVTGEVDAKTGWIIDFHDLESIVREHAIDYLDHTDMNQTIENPTTENLALWLHEKTQQPLSAEGVAITKIEIQEGDDCWCTLTVNSHDFPSAWARRL